MGKCLVLRVLDRPKKLSKNSLLAFTLVAMPFFVFLLSSYVPAQVIIKEKVEINPQGNILPEYPQSTLDPCLNINRPPFYQSVYSCSGYPVEPYQQMFPWQSGSYLGQLDSATIYNVEIISGTEYAYFYKVGYWDTLSNVQVDPEYIGSSLTGLTGVELAGWGEYRVYQGIGVWEREHFALYNIRFDNFDLQTAYATVRITNTITNEVTDWHTTIVNPQYTMQNLGIDGDTVLHNRSIIITPNISNSLALTCNQFGYGSCPPTNVTFNIEIVQGQEYGNIGKYDSYWGMYEYASAYTGLSYDEFRYGSYVFAANGLQPDSTAVVRIRQSSSDTDIGSFEYALNIKRNFLPPVSENGSIVIETNKNTAMPGDTLDILLKWEDGSNGIVDFADWQEFGVWLADGFGYGTLLDPVTGDTSDAFEVTGKELKLIVHQDVTDANKKIVIAAETEVAVLGGNRMMQNNPQPKTETKSTDKKIISNYRTVEQSGFVKSNSKIDKLDAVDKDEDDGEINIDIIIGSKYLSGIKEIIVNPFIVEIDPPTVSAGDTAKIIPKYMDENGNYVEFDSLQTFELGILDGCLLGKLSNTGIDTNYFYGVTQPFYFIADTSADSGSVNIRVGVINMNQQNRSLTNNINNFPESDNPVSCANVSFVEDLYVNANLVVGNVCATLPKCTENNAGKKPQIEVIDLPNGAYGTDYCQYPEKIKEVEYGKSVLGGYHEPCWSNPGKWIIINSGWWMLIPIPDRHIYNDFTIELCKDEFSDVVQFGIEGNAIYFKSIIGFCDNLIELANYTFINDTSELRTKIPQNEVDLLKVFNDLQAIRTYGLQPGLYYFSEVTWVHELQHNENFKTQILKFYNDNYDYLNYSKFDIVCEDATDINNVKEEMKQNYKESLGNYEKKVHNRYFEKYFGKDNKNREWNETKNTHERTSVTGVIDKYQSKVSDLIQELIDNKK